MSSVAKKKVLFVITKSNWGGAQAYVYTLAAHFQTSGYDVVVALGGTGTKEASSGELAEKLEAAGVRTVFVRSFVRDVSLTKEFKTFAELCAIMRHEKPDVVHLNSSKAGGIGALAARTCSVHNIVFTSHGLAFEEDRPALARLIIRLMTWFTFLLSHQVIVISKDNAERAARMPWCAKKIHLIYNGIAESALLTREDTRRALVKEAPRETLWLGTIAELTRNKGLSYLIEALALLKKKGHDLTTVIIGRGEERANLEALVARHGLSEHVHFAGFVPNANTYLRAFDLFVLPSVKEGLPYVLLEAGQAACAVVGSNISGVTDIIDNDTGLRFPPKDAGALADALLKLITDRHLREKLGDALNEKVAREFSRERMFTETEKIYARSN